jgi:hypothetical protein
MSTCPQLNIGIVAYGVTPGLVMVRVPNERGRWVLTDRSVVETPCKHCGAIAGEPCFKMVCNQKRYSVGTHYCRRGAAAVGRGHRLRHECPPKLHISAEDMAAAASEP